MLRQRILHWAFKEAVVPWLVRRTAEFDGSQPRPFAFRAPLVVGGWRWRQSPDQLVAAIGGMANAWMVKLALWLTAPDAQAVRLAAEAILPPPYNVEADFISDLVVVAFSRSKQEQQSALQRIAWTGAKYFLG